MHYIAYGMPGMGEWVIIAIIGLLFFGKRLPEVGRSLGIGIVEFKKGLKGIETDVEEQVDVAQRQQDQRRIVSQAPGQFDPVTGKPLSDPSHKFDPYTGQPIGSDPAVAPNSATNETSKETVPQAPEKARGVELPSC